MSPLLRQTRSFDVESAALVAVGEHGLASVRLEPGNAPVAVFADQQPSSRSNAKPLDPGSSIGAGSGPV